MTGTRRRAAWAVHALTASGAVLAWLALMATLRDDYRSAFGWLLAATIVDAVDGFLARLARVRDVIPHFDGARLDDIVDYLAYVFVPAVVIVRAGLLPPGWDLPVAALVLLSSAYGFGALDAKTPDHFFTGFPSYWNVVALYLFVLGLAAWANVAVVTALAGLVFVRHGYVYPTRTPAWRPMTLALSVAWTGLLAAVIWMLPRVSRPLVLGSLAFPLYYAALSVVLHRRRAR